MSILTFGYVRDLVDYAHDLVEEKRGKKHADMKFDFISNTIKIEQLNEEQDADSENELMQDI